jgi:hypothetical protein
MLPLDLGGYSDSCGQHDYSTLTEAIDALRYFPHKQASLQTLLFGFAVRTRKIFLFR